MKILHLTPSYWPAFERGGPIRSVHLLNKWLVKNGVDVTVYTTNIGLKNKVKTNEEVLLDGVKVWYFPLTWRAWQYSYEFEKQLKKTVKIFDLVHITSTFLAASTLGAYYAKKFNVPYIISPRGNLMKEPLKKKSPLKKRIYISLIEKKSLSGAAAIHFTTEMEQKEYIEKKLPLKKAIVIPNGIDLEEFNEKIGKYDFKGKYGKGKKIILFLGRINWKKGFDVLIPAFAGILKEKPNTILVIAGEDDGYKQEVEKLILDNNLEIDKDVIFTGQLLGDERIAAYKDSDVFVLPTYSENFGMAPLESMSVGTAVVSTTALGIASVLEQRAGKILEKNNPEELKNAVLDILENPEKKKEMENQAKKLVEEKFMMPKIAEEWVRAYSDLINKR